MPARPPTLLQLAPIGGIVDGAFADEAGTVQLWQQPDPAAWLAAHGPAVDVVVTSVRHGCDAGTMALLPNLKAICSWGAGFDTLDVPLARQRGIQVSTTPDVLDDCVADMAWALLLATARRVAEADRYVREGRWRRLGEFPLSTRVSGKRLGILGLGRIGQAVARRGNGFDMQIRYHGRSEKPGAPYPFEPSLVELARWCDFLVVACVGGPQTQHLVSDEVIRQIGPRGILVNIARGSVVDQAALLQALDEGTLGGAGLDVLQGEPGAPARLCGSDRVVLTPHIGSATTDTREAMQRLVVDNVRHFRATGRVLTPVASTTLGGA
jgi:lactate dehydrogenase-like 2-hydroxyacid dehydrogenase